jgi:hypothetical protein
MGQENMRVAAIEADNRIAQRQENMRIAEAYLAAIHTRDIQAVGHTLHPDLHAVGPTGEVHNRAGFLETLGKVVAHSQGVDITARMASGNQTFYMYNLVFAAPAAPLRTAALMTHHEDGRIKKIEIIADAAHIRDYSKNPK